MLTTLCASFTRYQHKALRRNEYQAWQDEVRGLQKIVRDGVETNIQVLDDGEVSQAALLLHSTPVSIYAWQHSLGAFSACIRVCYYL